MSVALVRGELWGGPFDGEWLDLQPRPVIVTVFVGDCGVADWPQDSATLIGKRVLGWYWWSDPRRLTWTPYA